MMNGQQRKDHLVSRAEAIAIRADRAAHRAIPAAVNNELVSELATLVHDLANFITNPPCCDGGPQWGHARGCKSLP